MPSINLSTRQVNTQGQTVQDNTAYISGDTLLTISYPIPGSGLLSGIVCNIDPTKLRALFISTDQPTASGIRHDVTFVGLSGTASVVLPPQVPGSWYSGQPLGGTNPLAIASGNITGLAVRNVSGYVVDSSGLHFGNIMAALDA